jgi:hypothetical protein
MTEKKYRKGIIDFLKSKNNYQPIIDDTLIDELVYQLHFLSEVKKDIAQRGTQINVRKGGEEPLYNLNQSVSAMFQSTKQIQSILRQLSISPADRLKMKWVEDGKGVFDLQDFLRN